MCTVRALALTTMLAIGAWLPSIGSAAAMPFGLADNAANLTAEVTNDAPLTDVRYHRRWRRGGYGFAAGVAIGGIAAAPYYYRPYPYYYSPAYPAYGPYSGANAAIAYCMNRFRSYDPYSGTYLGYDGFRHPCP